MIGHSHGVVSRSLLSYYITTYWICDYFMRCYNLLKNIYFWFLSAKHPKRRFNHYALFSLHLTGEFLFFYTHYEIIYKKTVPSQRHGLSLPNFRWQIFVIIINIPFFNTKCPKLEKCHQHETYAWEINFVAGGPFTFAKRF